MTKIKIVLWSILGVVFLVIIVYLTQLYLQNKVSGTAVVKQIRSLNRWETSSYTIEKIIDSGNSGNVFQKLLFGNRILLIANGEVIAGFDLSKVSEEDIAINNQSVTIDFPPPQILLTNLNERQTRVYDRQKGILVETNDNLETEARQRAVEDIRKAACDQGILTTASENAKKQATSILSSFGFTDITINIPAGSC